MTFVDASEAPAAGATLVPVGWNAGASASAAAAAGELVLRYDQEAGTDWLRALPIGNGRLGAMVFGNAGTDVLQLNEDTVWAGGPYDSSNTRARRRWPTSGGWCSPTSGARRRT
jgi:alpha-L-fucosidase 2